ncbi:hypothetical protein [Entomomonas asaccharolytica]|uniref:Uncharacterized protein n=1 Tax=Entomomonas asaccharolytica TaxID=2785331 RepID=A0A974RXS0_9GAMM|nr:hypothetical protein [Entomomonas asaccharolytica]QQP86437.1 hypothetical protein JHT90_04145 [Entomomonas asaccharolytica]
MKNKLITLLVIILFPLYSMADQWDDSFLQLIADKNNTLPYDIAEGYQVFDIDYDLKQRIFKNHIQITKTSITKQMIEQEYNRNIAEFCKLEDTQVMLNEDITYQFLFYRQTNEPPFLTIHIDKTACK